MPPKAQYIHRGHDVREYTLEACAIRFALVSQEVVLFNDTIRNNIAFGRDVSDDALAKAARAAHVMEFVNEKPDGLQTRVGDRGVALSGGQNNGYPLRERCSRTRQS